MRKLSLQLHILPEEIPILLAGLLYDPSVFVTLVSEAPLKFHLVEEKEFNLTDCKAVIFTLSPPNISARSISDFRRINPDCLVFEIGQLSHQGLAESWLWAMTENNDAMKRWKLAAKSIRSATFSGAKAMNPHTGETALMRGHRFSSGAQSLFSKGVAILPVAGHVIIKLIN
jgi:hypothetical protein